VAAESPGSLGLADAVAEGLAAGPGCVLHRHGALTVGSAMERALRRMLLLERLARLTAVAPRP
jgi:ribulose-5-phosphate 4-epimerase/fuculose-1-phosphate aldolase